MDGQRVSRRELLAAGAAAGAALGLQGTAIAGTPARWSTALDFRSLGPGDGWPGWTCPGVANLRRTDVALLTASGGKGVARLDLALMRDDGSTASQTRLERPLPRR